MTHNTTTRRGPLGFTLVELMVSIAMVVLLLFGIHQVFRMSSNTIGTGQAVNAITREIRAAQSVMQEDFRRSLKDSPLFLIHSAPAAAAIDPSAGYVVNAGFSSLPFHFNSRAERDRDIDGNPSTIDLDGDGTEETSYNNTHLAQVNDRIHRADIFGFFARGLFNRQTANDGLYVSSTKAYDAWVWYGHVRLPDPIAGGYHDPGAIPAANSESDNQFAANWVLGRRAILLKDSNSLQANQEAFIGSPGGGAYRGPLAYNSPSIDSGRGRATLDVFAAGAAAARNVKTSFISESRLDVAGTTLENYRADLFAHRQFVPANSAWWNALIFRYECDPRVRKPISSSNLAKTTPHFVGSVSQFLVEFAGDFVTQNDDVNDSGYGLVTDIVPDGVIDFVMLAPDVLDQTNPPQYPNNPRVRKTRWYGLPRDSNGDGFVTGFMRLANGGANAMPDVVPVSAVMATAANGTRGGNGAADSSRDPGLMFAPFEQWFPDNSQHEGRNGFGNLKDPAAFRYVCAWTNGAPAMVRIVMKLEDPAGRLADGQWVEFVLDAP